MKKLPLNKNINNLYYSQVKRTDKIALYDVRLTPEDSISGYELFVIKIQKAGQMTLPSGEIITLEEKEKFRKNEEFGFSGWSIMGKEKAEDQYNKLDNLIKIEGVGTEIQKRTYAETGFTKKARVVLGYS